MLEAIEFMHNGKEYLLRPEQPDDEEALKNILVYSICNAADGELVKGIDFGFPLALSLYLGKDLKVNLNKVSVF